MDENLQMNETTALQLIEAIKQLAKTLQKIPITTKEPKFLFAKDVSKILKINVNSATNLMKSEDFPSIKIGTLKVEEQAFFEWCKQRHER